MPFSQTILKVLADTLVIVLISARQHSNLRGFFYLQLRLPLPHIQFPLFPQVGLILPQCIIFGLHIFVLISQLLHLIGQTVPAYVQFTLMADFLNDIVNTDILVVFLLGCGVVKNLFEHA